jgi:PKD repeat protein
MAITQVGTASNSGGTGPVSVTPSGTRAADDIVIVTGYQRPGTALSVSASGLTFTAVVTATTDATYGSMGAWWARYPNTTNPAISVAGSTTANVSMAVTAVVLRGADTSSTPLTNVGSITNQAAAASFTVTGPTSVAADTVMIGVGGSLDNNAPTADWSAGSGNGSSLTVDNSSGTDNAIGMAWEWVSGGTAGNFVYTETALGNDAGRTLIFGVKVAAAVAPVASFTISDTTVWAGDTVTFTDTSTNTPTDWSWDFGSGASPATASTVGPHDVTYSTTGTKTITLTASNSGGSDAADNGTVTVYATIDANFSADDTTANTSQTVRFTDSSTNTPTTWSWNFGSGATPGTASTQGPHDVTYSTTGLKTVTLTAGNAGGTNLETKTNYIDVGTVPVSNFTISDANIWTTDSVNFTDTSTNSPTSWSWNFGSGATPATSTSQSPTGVTWSTTGTKTITLTATNAYGAGNQDTDYVYVHATVTAAFSANDTTVTTTESVNFTDSSTGTPTGWSWDFGSGASPATSTSQNPTGVTWSTTGNKTISLTASNAGGSDNETKTDYIVVSSADGSYLRVGGAKVIASYDKPISATLDLTPTISTYKLPHSILVAGTYKGWYNTFEGGTNGNTITINEGGGSGTDFTSVSGSPKWSNAYPKNGSMGMLIPTGSTSLTGVGWTGYATGLSLALQFWYKHPGYTTGDYRLLHFRDTTPATAGGLLVSSTGKMRVMQSTSGYAASETSSALTVGNWYLIDLYVLNGYNATQALSPGVMDFQIHNADGTTFHSYQDTFKGPATTANINSVLFGRAAGVDIGSDIYIDDIRYLNGATDTIYDFPGNVRLIPTILAEKLTGGFEIWNGTSWRTDFEIWNGTSWRTDAEIWNGTSWIPM